MGLSWFISSKQVPIIGIWDSKITKYNTEYARQILHGDIMESPNSEYHNGMHIHFVCMVLQIIIVSIYYMIFGWSPIVTNDLNPSSKNKYDTWNMYDDMNIFCTYEYMNINGI